MRTVTRHHKNPDESIVTIDTRREADRRQSTEEWLGAVDRRQNVRRFEDKSLDQVRAEEELARNDDAQPYSWADAPRSF
jgi:hypothetical protein